MKTNKIYLHIFIICMMFSSACAFTAPLSWSELNSPSMLPRRSQEQIAVYQTHLKQHHDQGRGPEESVLVDIFSYSPEEAKHYRHVSRGKEARLLINTFPYWLEDNIVHLLMFVNSPDWDKENLISQTKQILAEKVPALFNSDLYDYTIRINPPIGRSVPGLAHTHIFIRTKQQSTDILKLVSELEFSKPNTPPVGWKSEEGRDLPNERSREG